jgi:hypothetical protein
MDHTARQIVHGSDIPSEDTIVTLERRLLELVRKADENTQNNDILDFCESLLEIDDLDLRFTMLQKFFIAASETTYNIHSSVNQVWEFAISNGFVDNKIDTIETFKEKIGYDRYVKPSIKYIYKSDEISRACISSLQQHDFDPKEVFGSLWPSKPSQNLYRELRKIVRSEKYKIPKQILRYLADEEVLYRNSRSINASIFVTVADLVEIQRIWTSKTKRSELIRIFSGDQNTDLSERGRRLLFALPENSRSRSHSQRDSEDSEEEVRPPKRRTRRRAEGRTIIPIGSSPPGSENDEENSK